MCGMGRITYNEFSIIFRIEYENRNKWLTNFDVRDDGIYIKARETYGGCFLTPEELAVLTEHPAGNLSEPALRFPCSKKDLTEFIDFYGLRGCYDSEALASFEDEPEVDRLKLIDSKSLSSFPFIENAHIEINNYYALENADQPKASTPPAPKEQTGIPAAVSSIPSNHNPDVEQKLQEYLSEKGQKGGKAPKISQPILKATIQFINEKSGRLESTAEGIYKAFKRKYPSEEKQYEINIDGVDYGVYCLNDEIYAKAYKSKSVPVKTITFNTFKNSYISKAKKQIEASKV